MRSAQCCSLQILQNETGRFQVTIDLPRLSISVNVKERVKKNADDPVMDVDTRVGRWLDRELPRKVKRKFAQSRVEIDHGPI